MDSSSKEITHDFPPFFKVYKDGSIEKYWAPEFLPPGLDPTTGVLSKDVVVLPESGVSARIFIPKINDSDQKLPLLVHYHGGGFCIGSPFDNVSQNFLTSIVSSARIIVVSVDYRLAPEHLLPIAYDDSWAALQWIATHSNGFGPEPWINQYADFRRIFLAGESAGANITHYVAVRAGATGLAGVKICGALIVHPFFGGNGPDNMYKFMCPTSSGLEDDPKLNPRVDPDLGKMGCDRVLVCVAEHDWLRDRGLAYYETLGQSEWAGSVEFEETKGEGHCFHVFSPNSEKVGALIKRMVDFINQE